MGFVKWFKGWWLPVWAFFLKVLKEVAAPVTDFADHLDIYRIMGIAAFAVAGWIAFELADSARKVIDLLTDGNAAVAQAAVGIISGLGSMIILVSVVAKIGYDMFSHAKDMDKTLVSASAIAQPVQEAPTKVGVPPLPQAPGGPLE